MESTTLAAWWGAGAGTGVLLWDIYKWWSKGAKFKILTRCNVAYPNSRVVKTEMTAHGSRSELATYCHIEVRNIGESSATLISITATHTDKKKSGQMFCSGPSFESLDGKALPVVLSQGAIWSVRIEMDQMQALLGRGRPYLELHCSQRTKPLRAYVDLPKKGL
jgi:hypothetical protein